MILLIKLLMMINPVFASTSVRVLCEVEVKNIPSGFSLAAKLNLDETNQTVSTDAVITLEDFFMVPSEEDESDISGISKIINTPIVVSSRGFYRRINALGGYTHTVLMPLKEDSRVLSIDIKLDIDQDYQSVVELDETKKYYSNCRTLN